jgi:hypothetical protein
MNELPAIITACQRVTSEFLDLLLARIHGHQGTSPIHGYTGTTPIDERTNTQTKSYRHTIHEHTGTFI